ncbi:MAG TPA: DUF5399 family protein [Rhabdochlamydiaceae bacterium]|jgi:hypothetical protein
MPPRTIDNLGIDASTRYAEDQKIYDKTHIKEAPAISVQTEVEVTTPFFPSELDTLLRFSPLHLSWAAFSAPALYYEQKKRLFTFQSIPSMGSQDKKESQAQKILAQLQLVEEKHAVEDKEEKDQKKKREREIVQQEQEKEKKILTALLQTIILIDKLIIDINSRRGQYQKG